MKIAIVSDLHSGCSGTGKWHNKQMFDFAAEITAKTVQMLNQIPADLIVILGDITHTGSREELSAAFQTLKALTPNWFILPGNHDRPAMQNNTFKYIFEEHFPQVYQKINGFPSLFLKDNIQSINSANTVLSMDYINNILEIVKREKIHNLFIFSHIPLISQKKYADRFSAQYVPHYSDGNILIDNLKKIISGKIISFCGHQHWHRIKDTGRHLLCATASLIEYPMEARLVTIHNEQINIETLNSACPIIANASLISAEWTKGTCYDRTFSTTCLSS